MAVYFDAKKKTWYCQFKFKDWTGATRSTTKRGFSRKKEAQQYETDFKNHSTESCRITLSLLADKYLEDYRLNHKPSSFLAVNTRLREHVLPSMGTLLLTDITPYRIKEWQNSLKTKGLRESTILSVNVAFNSMLNYAVKYFGLPSNPFLKSGMTGARRKRSDFWELEEFQRVSVLFKHIEDAAAFNLLFWSGMRIGELQALTPQDFDFSLCTVSISKTYNYALRQVLAPKTATAARTIAIPPAVMETVRSFFESFYEIPPYPFQIVTYSTLRSRLAVYAREAGVKPITPHALRHSHASYLIQRTGASLPTIARRLGHSSPAVTLSTYAHMYHDADTDLALEMDQFVKSSSKVRQPNK